MGVGGAAAELPSNVYGDCPLPHTGFEGPEKVLEVWFSPNDADDENDMDANGNAKSAISDSCDHGFEGHHAAYPREALRTVPRRIWEDMLTLVKAEILNHISNEHLDAYLLSESSMFVYPRKVVIKTCGTTTLLNALPRLLRIAAEECGLTKVENVFYSRKNFMFPEKQLSPHTSFNEEVSFLDAIFDNGSAYVVGRLNGDHWYLYMTENKVPEGRNAESKRANPDQTLEILMTELDPVNARAKFYKDESFADSRHMTKVAGIDDIYPGTIMDDFMFTPCGYSLNGLMKKSYYTIHVTPEPHCSFASFETNVPQASYSRVVNKVLDIFRPGKFTLTLFTARAGPKAVLPEPKEIPGYRRREEIAYRYEEHDLVFHHYTRM